MMGIELLLLGAYVAHKEKGRSREQGRMMEGFVVKCYNRSCCASNVVPHGYPSQFRCFNCGYINLIGYNFPSAPFTPALPRHALPALQWHTQPALQWLNQTPQQRTEAGPSTYPPYPTQRFPERGTSFEPYYVEEQESPEGAHYFEDRKAEQRASTPKRDPGKQRASTPKRDPGKQRASTPKRDPGKQRASTPKRDPGKQRASTPKRDPGKQRASAPKRDSGNNSGVSAWQRDRVSKSGGRVKGPSDNQVDQSNVSSEVESDVQHSSPVPTRSSCDKTQSGRSPSPSSSTGSLGLTQLLHELLNVRQLSLKELSAATKQFAYELGRGGFGRVVQGVLPNGRNIVVKTLFMSVESAAREIVKSSFKAELKTLGQARHKNLISLLGFCVTPKDLMLVYDYMPKSSLEKWIYIVDENEEKCTLQCLNWAQRLRVIRGISQGLLYLHDQCPDQIILHLDIKPANILLSENFVPKLADFGLAKIMPEAHRNTTYSLRGGTKGYMAPESIEGAASTKSDVYSFGCVLMEIVRGRRNTQWRRQHGGTYGGLFFPYWAGERGRQDTERFEELDSSIPGFQRSTAEELMNLALMCVKPKRAERPDMERIVYKLDSMLGSPGTF